MLGKILRNYRKQNNLTQEQLAIILNISSNYISKLEREVSTPSSELAIIITYLTDCSLDDIYEVTFSNKKVNIETKTM